MKKRLNILYISQYFPPEMGAPAARVFELSREWAQAGLSVTVLTAMPNHPIGVVPPEYRGKVLVRETTAGINVTRCWIFPAANRGFLKRVLNYASFMFSAILLGIPNTPEVDVVIGTSPQFLTALAAFVISRIKRAPFIFEVRDLWPESIVQLGQIRNPWIIRLLEWLEMFLYRQASHIVVVTDSTATTLQHRGIPADKISVIKNGVDLQLFAPRPKKNQLLSSLKLNNKFIVTYIGTHGLSHALHVVLAAAKQLQERTEIHFLFIGEGAEKERLQSLARLWQLKNVTFLPQLPKQQLPDYYALSDVIVVPLRRLPLFTTVIPSKIFEIMAMGKPILLSVEGEARQLVEAAGAGQFVPPEDPNALAQAIVALQKAPEQLQKMGQAGRQFVAAHFNRRKLANQYQQIIEHVIKKHQGV